MEEVIDGCSIGASSEYVVVRRKLQQQQQSDDMMKAEGGGGGGVKRDSGDCDTRRVASPITSSPLLYDADEVFTELAEIKRELASLRLKVYAAVHSNKLQDQFCKVFGSFTAVVIPLLMAYFIDYWTDYGPVMSPYNRQLRSWLIGICLMFSVFVGGPMLLLSMKEMERLQANLANALVEQNLHELSSHIKTTGRRKTEEQQSHEWKSRTTDSNNYTTYMKYTETTILPEGNTSSYNTEEKKSE